MVESFLIHKCATTLAGQIGLRVADYVDFKSAQEIAQHIQINRWMSVCARLPKNASTRGEWAQEGTNVTIDMMFASRTPRVTLREVHGGKDWLPQDGSGRDITSMTAATTVIAAIADNFWKEVELRRKVAEDSYKPFQHVRQPRDGSPKDRDRSDGYTPGNYID